MEEKKEAEITVKLKEYLMLAGYVILYGKTIIRIEDLVRSYFLAIMSRKASEKEIAEANAAVDALVSIEKFMQEELIRLSHKELKD